VTDGQADRYDEANSHFLQFFERAYNGIKMHGKDMNWLPVRVAETPCKELPDCKTLMFRQACCWDTTPCCGVSISQRFEESSCLFLLGSAVQEN
jgi:hypothetical protein